MHKIHYKSTPVLLSLMICVLSVTASVAIGQNAGPMAVPADFIKELTPPGDLNHFLRPGQIYFDDHAAELYVVDQGHNRIVIFDRHGTYRFEFPVEGYCGSVRDLVVNSEGMVLILGSTRDGMALMRFDFDGLYLGEVDPAVGAENRPLELTSLAIDDDDRVYLLDKSGPRIIVLSADLEYRSEFPILTAAEKRVVRDAVYGFLEYHDSHLWLPVSNLGVVYRYGTDGAFGGTFGRPGTRVGELNFPSALSFVSDELILILDKRRFAVICHSRDGTFLGEFGGMGVNPGWFYYPSWMATGSDGRVYIGQVFMNRVQMCRIPERIQSQVLADDQIGSISD